MSATESDAKLRRLRAFVDSRTVEANEGMSYARGAANIAMQVLGEIDRLLAEPEPVKSEPELHKCCEEQRGVVVPEDVREKLAALEHEQWMAWATALMTTEALSSDRVHRWKALLVPYESLTEPQKDQDRWWADKALAILSLASPQPAPAADEECEPSVPLSQSDAELLLRIQDFLDDLSLNADDSEEREGLRALLAKRGWGS